MRGLIHFLLCALLALPGTPAGAHVCTKGDRSDLEQAHVEESSKHDDGVTCHGHDAEAATAATKAPRTTDKPTAVGDELANDDGSGECCGNGLCECPCAKLAALQPAVAFAERLEAPEGPVAVRIVAPPLAGSGPPLRPPIA